MLVRVRPAGQNSNRITDEGGPQPTADGPQVTGRAVNGDERRLSGSTLLATRGRSSRNIFTNSMMSKRHVVRIVFGFSKKKDLHTS